MERIRPIPRKLRLPYAAVGAVGLGVGLSIYLGGCSWPIVDSAPHSSATRPATGLPSPSPLPTAWPKASILTPNDCRPGALLVQQWPRHIDDVVTATIDNRCVVDNSNTHASVRQQPAFDAPVTAQLPNGSTVRLDCQILAATPGMHDRRIVAENPAWLGVSFVDPATSGVGRGFINAASVGWLELPMETDVVRCPNQ
jgi:hypothetical protein